MKETERKAVYANRRRIRTKRGKELLRRRGELLERPFARALETGGMRRTHLRFHDNIFERLLIHVAGVDSRLLMRTLVGVGKSRCLQGRPDLAAFMFRALLRLWLSLVEHWARTWEILAGIASVADLCFRAVVCRNGDIRPFIRNFQCDPRLGLLHLTPEILERPQDVAHSRGHRPSRALGQENATRRLSIQTGKTRVRRRYHRNDLEVDRGALDVIVLQLGDGTRFAGGPQEIVERIPVLFRGTPIEGISVPSTHRHRSPCVRPP